ncbi:MAG TPA: hypothetical protein VG960_00740 [Caulobacteraceae bacterium]|nr:hypothetical protein [Caulobacteraceae bacterium]
MIGAILALALQVADATPAPAAAPSPPTSNAADAIADIIAGAAAEPPPAPAAAPAPPPPPPGPTPEERAQMYESGVRSTFQAREARQGPLDGRWVLTGADGKSLYMIQLADPGPGRGPVEGAWRDLERQGAVGASGFLASAERLGQELVLKFDEDAPCVVTLTLGADGRWSGALRTAAANRPVTMSRS